ncbi:hypothetical protein Tco_1416867, partial [Tanacetum coccineum]
MCYRWKALDFVPLDGSSVSFSINEKLETAMPRWSKARTRAAKVGKGLFKNKKLKSWARNVVLKLYYQLNFTTIVSASLCIKENNGLIEPKKTKVLMPGMFLPRPSHAPTPSPNPTATDKEAVNGEQ